MYGLCDCNNFFASCERVFNPALRDRPVLVLSSNDGCVIARTNETKALGIKMAQPYFQIKELCEREHVAVFSTNFILYGDMSRRVMRLLRDHAPAIEVYSIDEAFMDLHGIEQEKLTDFGRNLARIVKRQTGIPVSIGVAPTKTLAKIAASLCKRYPRLEGCCVMHRAEDIEKVLKTMQVEEVWGIGRRGAAKLHEHGIHTAWEFTQAPPGWIRQIMSVTGLRTQRELQGISCIEIDVSHPDKQTICTSRSFAHDVYDRDELERSVSTFASLASEKLRRQGSAAGQVLVFLGTNRFRDDLPQTQESRVRRLEIHSDSAMEIISHSLALFAEMYRPELGYKKAGVILSSIVDASGVQGNLFDVVDRAKQRRLTKAMDALNKAHGRGTVIVAAQGLDGVNYSSDHLSPCYTTNWSDIIKVKV